jgi:hypothetical protein
MFSGLVSAARRSAPGLPFRLLRHAVRKGIEHETPQRAMALLRLLIATGETTIEAFHASANPVDEDFVKDLERIIRRSRDELAVLSEHRARVE